MLRIRTLHGVFLWMKDPDPDPGDPKRPDLTGSRSGSATLIQSTIKISLPKWSWPKTTKPLRTSFRANSSYQPMCSPNPWVTNIRPSVFSQLFHGKIQITRPPPLSFFIYFLFYLAKLTSNLWTFFTTFNYFILTHMCVCAWACVSSMLYVKNT